MNIDITGKDEDGKTPDDKIKDVLKNVNKDTLIKNFKIEHYVEYVKNYNCEFNPLSMKVGGDIESIEFSGQGTVVERHEKFLEAIHANVLSLSFYFADLFEQPSCASFHFDRCVSSRPWRLCCIIRQLCCIMRQLSLYLERFFLSRRALSVKKGSHSVACWQPRHYEAAAAEHEWHAQRKQGPRRRA